MISSKMRFVLKSVVIAALAGSAGVGLSTSAMARLTLDPPPSRLAQATPPLQSTPGSESKPSAPAEPATTGQRPQETPPQPARPDSETQGAGAKPALPAAPAEKVAPPIPAK